MKTLLFIASMLLYSINSLSQPFTEPKIIDRTIEVVAFASKEVVPNVINVSFILTEYHVNGKSTTIEESVKNIKEVLKSLNYGTENLLVANVYGFQNMNENNEAYFEHKIQFTLKLKNVEDVHLFLHKIDKRSIESFNIDEMYYENDFDVMRSLQKTAYNNAKQKADEFLKIYGEECGRLLSIEEVSGNITSPEINGRGSSVKTINSSNGINNSTSTVKSKTIKMEYLARVVFEIK
jgi:uncharacterized protein YggE